MKTSLSFFIVIVMAIVLQSCHRFDSVMNDDEPTVTVDEHLVFSPYGREVADSASGGDEPRKDRQQWRPLAPKD